MNNQYSHKISIGTVQFGLNYGIGNKTGQTELPEVIKILNQAKSLNINTLDTAELYGSAEHVLGEGIVSSKNWSIISKCSIDKHNVGIHLKNSLTRLKCKILYGYLFHNAQDLIATPSKWNEILVLKEQNLVKKVGFSAYYPEEVNTLIELGISPDIIQIPYSIFDLRFKPFLKQYKSIGIEIHTRSSYLQGLAFIAPNSLSSYFDEFKPFLKLIQEKLHSNNVISASLLAYCLKQKNINKVIIGVNNSQQLHHNINSLELGFQNVDKLIELRSSFNFNEKKLIPFNWPK